MANDPSKLGPGEEWDATKDATAAAAAQGKDMGQIQGTGKGGTVTEADVDAHDAAVYTPVEHENFLRWLDLVHHESRERTIARLKAVLKAL